MKNFTVLLGFGMVFLLTLPTQAQTKPAAKPATPAPTASAAVEKPADAAVPAGAPSLISDKMDAPASTSGALKVSLDNNPLTKSLIVRTDAAGPTRVEINDGEGRPVLTRNMMVGNKPTALDVSRLPAGYYIVQCTAGERKGMRRVMLGQ
ncbi:T9SS type A sorting domain-containing protein [Hymenobacter qilianensis]|uniref:T9SS type A sorting domain-containing protein n=1 Tax=Hymenobacter qilianensis TaxID=1385715 RepID=A0A7H0GYP7_9BACT|nr:T9SS type A sorting domain-containing protein [Hymenobacter qilianensis]QNP53413.1 T9SS type A sorting domain-containing protein [Hymenobacter qilianensis]